MPTDNQLTIAICDDAPADLNQIHEIITRILRKAGIHHSISAYESAASLLSDIRSDNQFHILFLDVMMKEQNGLDLAAQLRKQQNQVPIVFISANREMALYGYEVSAVRYLAKPIDEGKLEEALMYCVEEWQKQKEILLPTGWGQYRISVSDILFIEAFDRGIRVVLENETVESRLKFREAEMLLPMSSFIRCHRAFLVNPAFIKCLRPYEFILLNGQHIPVGKARYPEIRRKFVQYISA